MSSTPKWATWLNQAYANNNNICQLGGKNNGNIHISVVTQEKLM